MRHQKLTAELTATTALASTPPPAAPALPPHRGPWLRFLRHFLEMVAAMYVGMLALDPVYGWIAGALGYSKPWTELPLLSALVMAFNMTLPMVLWMRHHRHGWRPVTEMAGAMLVPALGAAGLYASGSVSSDSVMSISHLGMFPAMVAVMLYRFEEYTS